MAFLSSDISKGLGKLDTVLAAPLSDFKHTTLISIVAVIIWLGGIHVSLLCFLFALFTLPSMAAYTILAIQLSLVCLPVGEKPYFGEMVAKFVSDHAPKFFPLEFKMENREAFDTEKTYVIALEPHSIFPIGVVAMTRQAGRMPLQKMKCLASSAIWCIPWVRHLWSWLGLTPASRQNFRKLLSEGYSTVLIPGGVQECLHLRPGAEVVFLKQRTGFIRMAMEAGAPLVPAFCFGQTNTYRYWKPKGEWFARLSRSLGFTPLFFWGWCGTPLPFPEPMLLVVGSPIDVPKNPEPTREEILGTQEKFLAAMTALFEKYKEEAGYPDLTLEIR
ncbi:Diacylglycerol acyltransferase 2 [Klebsormidium nitens]|uniref:Acyltransferase n=1 Tax=Klebsormidium nitens TaxID=105231 RepID=A0A1Y1IF00_KLENI|nr:Diacylglycerol acyltransferase 2 [Klebsormidium nitens]|eukprot:GAQ87651.1 Diacylglycerol acyltransferase 2 [Klebsormidium nitens]